MRMLFSLRDTERGILDFQPNQQEGSELKMLSCLFVVGVFAVTGFSSKSHGDSRKAAKDICRNRCVCEEKENVLNIHCESKGFTSLRSFHAPPNRVSQLFFNGNSLTRLGPSSFANFSQAVALHLGDNGLQDIKVGAFQGLRTLKRLHLNNNNLEVLRTETFSGLESLEYLQADYNYISHIEPGAFSQLTKLKVLILNDNLLPSLPGNVFRFVLLTHLDLRGNRLRKLPFAGVLEHIGGIVEIQLEENPWNCTCELMPLKAWLDTTIPFFVGEMVCETPFRLHGKDVTQLNKQDLCPRKSSATDSNLRVPQPFVPDPHLRPPARLPATPTPRSPKAARPAKPRKRPTPRVPKDRQIFGPIMVYQTKSPAPITCPNLCTCSLQSSDSSGLNVHCHERSISHLRELQPRPSHPKRLYLTGNLLVTVRLSDLEDYSATLELLHLGNNRISVIQEGAFRNLTHLRRLYLNGNHLEGLSPAMFQGLRRLQYLYLESNVIKAILPSTFGSLANLHLLYLNNNLLRSLPAYVFAGTNLTRLNLRNNHFSHLPVRGVLDQLSALVQIDLQENPWDCSCEMVALKSWMEQPSATIVVNEVTCESPAGFAGKLLGSLRKEDMCPEHSDIVAATIVAVTYSSDVAQSHSQSPSPGMAQSSAVPLSVLILGLLVVFILSVCFGAGLFVFVLKRRKGGQSTHNSTANNLDLSSYQLQYGSYNAGPNDKTEAHVYNYISHPVGQMCKNPIYIQRENDQVTYFRDLQELSYSGLDVKKRNQLRNPTYTISTVELLEKQPLAPRQPELLYQNIAERDKELPSSLNAHYSFCTLPKRQFTPSYEVRRQNQDRLNKTVLYGTPRKHFGEPSKIENLSVQGKPHTEPDYLEVLEKQTAISQL